MSTVAPTGATGYAVASVGRRIGARLLDGLVGLILYGAEIAAFLSGRLAALGLVGLLFLCWFAFVLYALFALAATPGQLMLGLRQLDAETGLPSGGRAFLKQLIMGVLGTVTFGLILLVALLALQGSWKRTWFDRMAGTVVGRRSLDMATTSPLAAPAAPPTPVPWSPEPSRPEPARVPSYQPTPSSLGTAPDWAAEAPTSLDAPREASLLVRNPPPPAPAPTSPRIMLDDGGSLTLDRPHVLGRDPVAPSNHPHAAARPIDDPQCSLSKTHLLLEAETDTVWCTDLHSTNGVTVTDTAGRAFTAAPGERTRVPTGAVVTFGRRTLRVQP